MDSESQRGNGFLNKKHRNYLRNKSTIESDTQSERDARRYIREHLRNAILDFSEVFGDDGHRVEARDRWKAFGGLRPIEAKGGTPGNLARFIGDNEEVHKEVEEEMQEAFINTIAFIYGVSSDAGLDGDHILKRGIQKYAEAELSDHAEPKVLLETDTRENRAYRAKQKIKRGEPPEELTDEEVRALLSLAGGPLTPERIQKYLAGEWSWPPSELEESE